MAFDRIVAAIDNDPERSSEVLRTARDLAGAFQSHVLIVHVRDVERSAAMVATAGKPSLPPMVHFETQEAAQQLVDTAVNDLKGDGIDAGGQVGHGAGSTARELLDIASDFGADLIVVGDRNSRVTDLLLGGVSHRIVHLADCPVLLVR